jgi:hypothetical protein
MPNLPSGKGQLNITGIRSEVIAEFKKLCDQQGRKQGRQFEIIFYDWMEAQKKSASTTSSVPYATHGGIKDKIILKAAEKKGRYK